MKDPKYLKVVTVDSGLLLYVIPEKVLGALVSIFVLSVLMSVSVI